MPKLKESAICLDCDEVFPIQGTNPTCPVCCSHAFMPLSTWVPAIPSEESSLDQHFLRFITDEACKAVKEVFRG